MKTVTRMATSRSHIPMTVGTFESVETCHSGGGGEIPLGRARTIDPYVDPIKPLDPL